MPVYEYLCATCGPFTATRPMVEFEAPQPCQGCGSVAPRVLLTAPHLATMSSQRRLAVTANERSADTPRRSSEIRHGSDCSCCASSSAKFAMRGKNAAKGFPTRRPWMISH